MIKNSLDSWTEVLTKSIELTTCYLESHPDSWTSKKPFSVEIVTEKITKTFNTVPVIGDRTTTPDVLVSDILELLCNCDPSQRDIIQRQYNQQKQVEQKIIGLFLEFYILKNSFEFGWVQTGDCLSGIDMIKDNSDGTWNRLQIKNSNNSQNSSSKGFISGKGNIITWSRRHSTKGTYFWDTFPDEDVRKLLSEEDFKKFIFNYYTG